MEGLDVISQGEDIDRRRKLIAALQQQSMGAPIVGNTGLGQALAKIATAYLTSKGQAGLAQESAANQGAYNAQLGAETNSYLDRYAGKKGGTLSPNQAGALLNNDQDPGILPEPVKADPREAVVRALTSRLPEMQKLGQAGMAQLQKPREVKEHVIGGTLVRSDGISPPSVAGTYGQDDLGPLQVVGINSQGKPIQAQLNKKTGKYEYAPDSAGQTINVDTKGNGLALEQTGKVLGEARQAIIGHSKAIEAANRLYALSQDPQVISGFGANQVLGLGSLAKKLGFEGQEGVAKTQALMTDLAAATLEKGQAMKGSFSDSDIKFLQDAAAGKISLDPTALRHVAGLAIQAGHNGLRDADQQYRSAATVKGADELIKLYPIPPWKHKIPEGNAFQIDDNDRITYNSGLIQQTESGPGKAPAGVVHWSDYMKGQ